MNTIKNMNTIKIDSLKVFAHHGVFPEETEAGQDFFLSAVLFLDTAKAGSSDDLSFSVDYGAVCHFLTEQMKKKTFKLIEAAADDIACRVMSAFPLIEKIELTLSKPHAPVGLPFENISVTVCRSWHDAYLSIGSNMGNRRQYLDTAVAKLKSAAGCRVEKVSSYINTKPYGNVEQADFLNGSVYLRTLDTPYELLERVHLLEQEADRKREIHWGPRTLDIDIIFYDGLVLDEGDLILPHPDMENRSFVLIPLNEIAPYKVHPLLHKRVKELLKEDMEM